MSFANGDPADGADPVDDWAKEDPVVLEPAFAPCWRCGRDVDPAQTCPFCRARPRGVTRRASGAAVGTEPAQPFKRLLIGYVVMMTPAIIWGLIVHADQRMTQDDLEIGTLFLEGFDTILTLALLAWIGWQPLARPSRPVRLGAWIASPFLLAGVLGVNVLYHRLLREALRLDWLPEPEHKFTLFLLLIGAVQPAVIEELFFRYLALGVLQRLMGVPWAVLISAALFAMAHVYQPLGLPWLLVMGVVLGYARVATGGLLLPMLLHFAHNAIVLGLEVAR